MTIVKMSGGYIAAVFPNTGQDWVTGKPIAERIYGRDEEELKRRINIRFSKDNPRDRGKR